MGRYFFDTKIGDRCVADESGSEAHDLSQAKEMAIRALPEMVRDAFSHGFREPVVVKIRDETGAYRFEAALVLQTVGA